MPDLLSRKLTAPDLLSRKLATKSLAPSYDAPKPFDPSQPPSLAGDVGLGYMQAAKPIGKALEIIHTPIERIFKAGSGIAGVGPIAGAISRGDISELKRYPESLRKGLKALVPWPGIAEDVPTFGETMAKDWYKPLVGKKAPGYYAPLMDLSLEVAVLGAGAAKRAQAIKAAPKYGAAKLTKAEIQAGKKLFSTKALAKMKPQKVRAILAGQERAAQAAAILEKAPIAAKATIPENFASKVKGATKTLTKAIRKAKRLRPQREAMIHKEKARRVAIAERIRQTRTGKEAGVRTRGILKGEYPSPVFEPVESTIDGASIHTLFESIRTSGMRHFDYRRTTDALMKVLSGELPTRGDINLLQKHFGKALGKAILAKRPPGQKFWETAVDIANIPRATLASWDLSFPLRQGGILLPGHPKQWAKSFGQMLKSAVPFRRGKEYARSVEMMAANSKWASLRSKSGLEITEWGLAGMTGREEPFMSSLAEIIPGVSWSNRTFTTMSNQLRINVFDDIARQWHIAGVTWDTNADAYVKLAKFLNHATGRGSLGRLQHIGPELNAVFFSPRYQISRPQVIYDAFASLKNAPARKVIAGDLVKYVGTGMTVLTLAKMSGADVEIDPRSSDFGKIRIGNTRYDYWTGNQPMARLAAQIITGQRKTTGTGKITDIERDETLLRFVRYKMSPAAGFAWDVLKKETVMGEELTPESFDIKREAWDRTAPMFLQDVRDAIRYQGLDSPYAVSETALSAEQPTLYEQAKQVGEEVGRGLIEKPITAGLAFTGVGVQTWEPSKWTLLSQEQDKVALETFGKEWDKLGPIAQRLLRQDNSLLETLKQDAQYERTGFPFIQQVKEEQLKAGRSVKAGLAVPLQKEMTRLKVPVGLLSRTVGEWPLSDERYTEYQHLIAQHINERVEVLKGKGWSELSNKHKRRLLENIISGAKKRARNEIKRVGRQEDINLIRERVGQ